MIFDIIIKDGVNENGKDIYKVNRVHDRDLSKLIRDIQDSGKYIFSIIPLFRKRREDNGTTQQVD